MTATSTLIPVKERGWRMGFANLLRNENLEWWGSRRWLVQAGLWMLVLNGMVALLLFVLPAYMEVTADDNAGEMSPVAMGVQAFFQVGAIALAINTIILAQGKIVGERQTGITAWILSKPVARPAYLLAKMVAHSIGILVIMVGLQSTVAYGLFWLADGNPWPLLPFLMAAGGLTLHTFFYLTFTLMMGVFARTRSQVLGVVMGSFFGGMLLPQFVSWLGLVTPWSLPDILPALAMQIPLPLATVLMPILMTVIWSVAFVAAALWKLSQLEL